MSAAPKGAAESTDPSQGPAADHDRAEGRFVLRVTSTEAYLTVVPARGGGRAVTVKEVSEALRGRKVVHGVDQAAVEEAVADTALGNQRPEFLCARATPPVHGADAQLEWCVEPESPGEGPFVTPGQRLARRRSATLGTPGKGLDGSALPARPGRERPLTAGEGVEASFAEGVTTYAARWLGTLAVEAGRLAVRTTARVSDDGLTAFADLPARAGGPQGRDLTVDDVVTSLERQGICHGIDREAIAAGLARAAHEPPAAARDIVVARGDPAEDGQDEGLSLAHDLAAGRLREDGGIDFHERDYPWNVTQGQIVGTYRRAHPARDGRTVRGAVIRGCQPQALRLALEGITEGPDGTLTAAASGALTVTEHALAISEVLVHEGDVGVATGNLRSPAAIHVKGHVLGGFIVESARDVVVDGNVEDAVVRAGGNVVVKGGVRGGAAGEQTEVHARGTVSTTFVEHAAVYAEGDIEVRRHVLAGRLASSASIRLGPSPGLLVGGHIEAIGEVWAGGVGRPGSPGLQVVLGLGLRLRQRLRELTRRRPAADRLTAAEQGELARLETLSRRAATAALRVPGVLFPNVDLRIGVLSVEIAEETRCRDYFVDPNERRIASRPHHPRLPIPTFDESLVRPPSEPAVEVFGAPAGPLRLLLADDSRFQRKRLRWLFEREGWEVVAECATGRDAVEAWRSVKPHLAVLDLVMEDEEAGLRALAGIKLVAPEARVCILTCRGEEEVEAQALGFGAFAFVRKPYHDGELVLALQAVLAGHPGRRHLRLALSDDLALQAVVEDQARRWVVHGRVVDLAAGGVAVELAEDSPGLPAAPDGEGDRVADVQVTLSLALPDRPLQLPGRLLPGPAGRRVRVAFAIETAGEAAIRRLDAFLATCLHAGARPAPNYEEEGPAPPARGAAAGEVADGPRRGTPAGRRGDAGGA